MKPSGPGLLFAGRFLITVLISVLVMDLLIFSISSSCPFSPHLLVADASVWGTSLLGVAYRHVICGVYLLFFLPVMLPSKIQKLPPDPPVRGFPGVWKLLL